MEPWECVERKVTGFYRGERVPKPVTTAPLVDSVEEVEEEDTLGEAIAKRILIPVGVRVDVQCWKQSTECILQQFDWSGSGDYNITVERTEHMSPDQEKMRRHRRRFSERQTL